MGMDKEFSLSEFLNSLQQRYSVLLDNPSIDSKTRNETRKRLDSLLLAQSLDHKILANQHYPEHPLQIGILGPTQAGKSTLVNVITRSSLAGVSPLAGYTVHAQGFAILSETNPDEFNTCLATLSDLFEGFEKTDKDSLDPDNYRQYTLSKATGISSTESPMVVWDSPDFDSIQSSGYRTAVLKIAALSDVLVFALSKDKYADKSVWDMVELLSPLNKPVVFVVNKLSQEDRETVLNALAKRIEPIFGNQSPPVIDIPYIRALDDAAQNLPEDILQALTAQFKSISAQQVRTSQRAGLQSLIDSHWDSWIEPITREHLAQDEWRELTEKKIADAIVGYRENYLDHPHKYDTFNRSIAELLTLLELPGLAGPLGATRKLVTWPMRKLLDISGAGGAITGSEQSNPTDKENDTLRQCYQQVLSELQNATLDRGDGETGQWWRALSRELRQQQESLGDQFEQQVDNYQSAFEPEIEKAAQQLYRNLEKQPAVLNSLRAARVTTDAAAIVLAVKSGGLAASDLLIAPAMLSVTSMLTEGAIGKYMDSVKQQMKDAQLQHVKQLLEQHFNDQLLRVPEHMDQGDFFAISADTLALATAKINDDAKTEDHRR